MPFLLSYLEYELIKKGRKRLTSLIWIINRYGYKTTLILLNMLKLPPHKMTITRYTFKYNNLEKKKIKMSVVSQSSLLMSSVKGNCTVSLGFEHFDLEVRLTYYKYSEHE